MGAVPDVVIVTSIAELGVTSNLQTALPAADGVLVKINSAAAAVAETDPLVSEPIVQVLEASTALKQYVKPKLSLTSVASGAVFLSLMKAHTDTVLK